MTIGALAKAAGVNVQTIRFYERQQLLRKPHRWPGSDYRDFDEDALLRLRFIRSAIASHLSHEANGFMSGTSPAYRSPRFPKRAGRTGDRVWIKCDPRP